MQPMTGATKLRTIVLVNLAMVVEQANEQVGCSRWTARMDPSS